MCAPPPPPAPRRSWVDLGQESGSAVKGGGGAERREAVVGGQVLASLYTHFSELARLPQCKAASGVPYQELERTWPVAGSGENECTGGAVLLVFSPSTEGWFLMMGAEF